MTEEEKSYVKQIWNDLTKEEQNYFNELPDKRKSVWLRHYMEDEVIAEDAENTREKQKSMVCRTCKFAGKMYNGKKPSDYTSGSCEKYETKPTGVYFDGEKCPKYEAK